MRYWLVLVWFSVGTCWAGDETQAVVTLLVALHNGDYFDVESEDKAQDTYGVCGNRGNALHQMARTVFSEEAFLLIKDLKLKDEELNHRDKAGSSPLHIASWIGNEQMVSFLLRKKAKIFPNRSGWSPLQLAAYGRGRRNERDAVLVSLIPSYHGAKNFSSHSLPRTYNGPEVNPFLNMLYNGYAESLTYALQQNGQQLGKTELKEVLENLLRMRRRESEPPEDPTLLAAAVFMDFRGLKNKKQKGVVIKSASRKFFLPFCDVCKMFFAQKFVQECGEEIEVPVSTVADIMLYLTFGHENKWTFLFSRTPGQLEVLYDTARNLGLVSLADHAMRELKGEGYIASCVRLAQARAIFAGEVETDAEVFEKLGVDWAN